MRSAKPSRIAVSVIANYLGQGWAALMAIAFLPIYVGMLGFEAYGLVGFFAVMQSVLAIFDLGIPGTLTREAARSRTGVLSEQHLRDVVRSFEIVGGTSSLILAVAIWGLSGQLAQTWVKANTLSSESVTLSITLIGFIIAARLQEGIYRGLLLGLERQVLFNIVNALLATVRYAGAIAVLHYGAASIEVFFGWQLLISILTLVTLAGTAYFCLPDTSRSAHFSPALLIANWRFSVGIMGVSGLSLIMANLDRLLLSNMLPLEDFGRYALASVAASTLYMLVVPITQGAFPQMVGAFASKDRLELIRLHHRSSQAMIVVTGSITVCIARYPMEVLYSWSGDLALANATAPLLGTLALAAFANCLGHIGYNLQLVSGSLGILIRIIFCALLVTLLVLPISVSYFGLFGGVYAWLGIVVLQASAVLFLAHRSCVEGEGLRWLTQDFLLPLLGAVAAVWMTSFWRPMLGEDRIDTAIFLMLAAFTSLGSALLLAPDIRNRIISMFNRRPHIAC